MDSLTQIVLGAGIGELTMGRKIGYKAQLIGAIAGTVPDLDVITNLWIHDAALKLHIHRSYSHALFVHVFLAIPLTHLTYLIFKKKYSWVQFYILWFLGLSTHAILDSFTTYGTQLLLPFTDYLVGFNNISVVDPLYTLPFMGLLIACLFYPKTSEKRFNIAKWSFYISSAYMLLTFGFKYIAHTHFKNELNRQHIAYQSISTSPTIFNSILWAGIVDADSMIYISDYSILQHSDTIHFSKYVKNKDVLKDFQGYESNTLQWFSQGKYFIDKTSDSSLNFYITKWGQFNLENDTTLSHEKIFAFYYKLTRHDHKINIEAIEPKMSSLEFSKNIKLLWRRILGE